MATQSHPTPDLSCRLSAGLLMLLAVGFVLAGCSGPSSEEAAEATAPESSVATAPAPASLEVRDVRANLMPNGMGAVYFDVVNGTGENDRLVGVDTDSAETAEMHETIDDAGVMKMVPHPDGFEIAAGETVSFAPGGRHVMLIGTQVAADALSIELTLTFETAGHVPVMATVSSPGGHMESEMEGKDPAEEGMDHGSEH